jgi:hypothetical protein
MPTIAKTKRYHELTLRYLKLMRLYSVLSELRLHTNKAVNANTAEFYYKSLYEWGDYNSVLGATIESMTTAFYIELHGFIGAYWDDKLQHGVPRENDQGSLGSYLYDGRRTKRKKTAIVCFEKLLSGKEYDLLMIRELRLKLAHFEKLKERNNALVPGDRKIREIMNLLAETLYLLGFQRWNNPHYAEKDNEYVKATQNFVDKLLEGSSKSDEIRKKYLKAREKWYGDK